MKAGTRLRCPSYRGSTKKSIEMYGPTLGVNFSEVSVIKVDVVDCINICPLKIEPLRTVTGPYLGFFVCGGKLGFREISDQYSYKKQPSKIRHYVRKKTFSFPGGGNCPLRPPAMYGPG